MGSPQTVPLDDGVQNLNQFCALVGAVNLRLDESRPLLESAAEDLERGEAELSEEADRLDDAVEDGDQRLDSGREGSSSALEELSGFADRTTDTRLPDVQDAIDEGAEALLAGAGQTGQRIDETMAAVSADGVAVFEEAVATLEADSAAALAEVEKELADLGSGLADLTETAVDRADETTSALEGTTASLNQEQARVAEHLKATTRQWDEQIDGGLLEGARGAGAAVQDAHASWDAGATETADSIFASVADAVSAAEEGLDAAEDAVATPSASLLAGPAHALEEQAAEAAALLEGAEALTSDLEPLLGDLRVTLRVVSQVDLLLQEMA